mgnify:CR=1 FL=1
MECKMSFLKYRVMKRLFLFAVCAWAGLSLWASSVKGQGTACETRSEKSTGQSVYDKRNQSGEPDESV